MGLIRKTNHSARLFSLLQQIPVPRRALDLGCGDDHEPGEYLASLCARSANTHSAESQLIGLDQDLSRLRSLHRRKGGWLVQADLTRLPFGTQLTFDLILIRHPDIDNSREGWKQAMMAIPGRLSDRGFLLITSYSVGEMEQIHSWLTTPSLLSYPLALDRLPPPDLAGRDRFVIAYQRIRDDRV